jgi:hypothetical protein
MAAPSWAGDIHSGTLGDSNPRLGRIVRTADGSEFVRLKGVASLALYDAVSYNGSTFASTRLTADLVGPVAVSHSANTTSADQSWFQIRGVVTTNSDTMAAATVASLYVDGTAGRVDDATSAGDWIVGMCSLGTDSGSNTTQCYLDHPWTYNSAYLT